MGKVRASSNRPESFSRCNMILCEIEYRTSSGERVTESIEGWSKACEHAKTRASELGRRVTIRKIARPQWYIIGVDLETNEVYRLPVHATKREAARFWSQWNAKKTQIVMVMWPSWAVEPRIAVGDFDSHRSGEVLGSKRVN